ncbi:MAG: lipoyl(octanoyl) transferase LipB [Thermodesulfobacteriota bacterium]
MISENMRIAHYFRLGLIDYEDALRLQNRLVQARLADKISDVLLFLQHPPVITIGKSGKIENIIVSQSALQEKGIKVIYTDRGGDVTFHGPGQLILYPILHLRNFGLSVPDYVWQLEEVIIRLLHHFGIKGERLEKWRGVWVRGEKIASLGIHLSRWITKHGLALNVNTALDYFNLINPCGTGRRATSMAKILGEELPLKEIEDLVGKFFQEVFNMELRKESPLSLESYLETNLATAETA